MMDEVLSRFNLFFGGSQFVSLFLISLFFLKFWRQTGDRLFLFFAGAFTLLMAERCIRSVMAVETDMAPFVYSVRLAAFILILVAIADKNRRS